MPIEDLHSFRFLKEHKIFLDANVWLFSFGPFPQPRYSGVYDQALRDMRIKKCLIHLNGFILSEFINAYARRAYYEWIGKNYPNMPEKDRPKFKDFRDSSAFAEIAEEIRIGVMGILQSATECCNPELDKEKAESLISGFGKICVDFNDQIIADICKERDYILLTDDRDFMNYKNLLTILTANPRALSKATC